MTNRIVLYSVAGLVPLAVIATTLGILLSMNSDSERDEDEGLLIAQVPNIGRLRGLLTNETTGVFLGVPFSQTTAGDYRWQKPRDPLPVTDDRITVDALTKGSACPQVCLLPSPEYSCPLESEMSEDCLNLNIYVPSRLTVKEKSHRILKMEDDSPLLPVLVFIYGGAYIAGANSALLYDGRFLAEKGDMIVVTVNYRVGPFGFFYQNEGTENPALGNFAIYDQIKALEWVQRHITDFGGDPNQVTISGQSAGAQSVAVLLLSEEADPLFHQAIMQSNPFGLPYKDIPAAQKISDNFAELANCTPNDMECLRSLSIEQMLYVYQNLPYSKQINYQHITEIFEPWAPILDQKLLTNDPMFLFNEGKNQNKPMIMGYVKDEGAMFIEAVFDSPIKSPRVYNLSARIIFGKHAEEVVAMYPPECPQFTIVNNDCDERRAMNPAVTDYMFICPGRKALDLENEENKETRKLWTYMLDQLWSFPEFWDQYEICYDLSCHSAELPYLFDVDTLTEYRFSESENELSKRIISYWSNFVKYGDPNGPTDTYSKVIHASQSKKVESKYNDERPKTNGQIYWPKYHEKYPSDPTVRQRGIKISGNGDEEISNYKQEECDFFDNMDYYLENYSNQVTIMEKLLEVRNTLKTRGAGGVISATDYFHKDLFKDI